MADAASSTPPPGEGSPFDDAEGDPLAEGEHPFGEENPFDQDFPGENPFAGENAFAGEDPFASGAFGNEPPAVMMAKLWIRQNALLSVGVAFAAGTLIGVLKK